MKSKTNPSGSTGIILLVGAAGLAYWYFTSQTALPTGVPAGSVFNPTGGGTAAAPKSGDCYSNASGIVVGVFVDNGWIVAPNLPTMTVAQWKAQVATASSATSTPAGNSVPVGAASSNSTGALASQLPSTGPTAVAPPTTTASGSTSLAQIGTNLHNAIAQYQPADPAISVSGGSYAATPYVWNYYISLPAVYGSASSLPGLISGMPLGSVFPGASLTAPMPLSTYWAGVMSYLGTQGMSGLRGLGYAARSPLSHARGAGWRV